MSILDWLRDDTNFQALAGIAGAAAMAATDWSKPWRFLQHLGVGTLCATFATPTLFPAIGRVLSWINVDPSYQFAGAAFIVGAFGIYILEFGRAVFRFRARNPGDGA
jgi:hypothetical protein